VCSSDLSDGSFLALPSQVVIVTNIDDDHLDHYRTMENMEKAYLQFINAVGPEGRAVLCVDDSRIRRLLPQVTVPKTLYGFSCDADIHAIDVVHDGRQSSYRVVQGGQRTGPYTLRIPGRHNVLNSLAAIGVARHVGVSEEAIEAGLSSFSGVKRRFQFVGESGGIKVFDDYAHHPTEIKATLASARLSHPRRLVVVFQPHRFSRTELLASSFAQAFSDADVVLLLPIYSAGENTREGVSSEIIYRQLSQAHRYVIQLSPKSHLEAYVPLVCSQLESGDWVFTVGAGDVNQMGSLVLSHLQEQKTAL
jgi:UDP-N-acetylmuramate--alanine ligase